MSWNDKFELFFFKCKGSYRLYQRTIETADVDFEDGGGTNMCIAYNYNFLFKTRSFKFQQHKYKSHCCMQRKTIKQAQISLIVASITL